MSILSDREIRSRIRIEPWAAFSEMKAISFGVSSYGYDIRLGNKYKIFTNVYGGIVDPKKFDERCFVDQEGPFCLIPPNGFILGHSVEKVTMPSDVMGVVVGKSTYARCGLIVNITPIEAGWSGIITIEISNTTSLPAKVYADEGIAQILFFEAARDSICSTDYRARNGKYMNQEGIVLPIIKGE